MVRFIEDGSEPSAAPLAPVIPLFGGLDPPAEHRPAPSARPGTLERDEMPTGHSAWDDDYEQYDDDETDGDDGESVQVRAAFERLIRKLRRRGLSVAEATDSLVADGVDRVVAEVFIAELEDRRWLGDAALAEQIVHTAVTRKDEGRRAIAQTLAKRAIPRDVADAALASLPDDDAARALEFARGKMRSMSGLDPQTATRRLMGQLARRGYSSSVALSAARQALLEHGV